MTPIEWYYDVPEETRRHLGEIVTQVREAVLDGQCGTYAVFTTEDIKALAGVWLLVRDFLRLGECSPLTRALSDFATSPDLPQAFRDLPERSVMHLIAMWDGFRSVVLEAVAEDTVNRVFSE